MSRTGYYNSEATKSFLICVQSERVLESDACIEAMEDMDFQHTMNHLEVPWWSRLIPARITRFTHIQEQGVM
jgi:hypothetical protein